MPKSLAILLLILGCWTMPGLALESAKTSFNLGHFNGLAMNGYDVMTYWRGGQPKIGEAKYSLQYSDATWQFISPQNRDDFAVDPARYAPQYGGFCAYAASRNALADVDPFAWRIWKDKLYLNYNPSVRRKWASDIDDNIEKGDQNWPGLDPVKSNATGD